MNSTDFPDSGPEGVLEEEATVWLFEREDGFAPGRSEAFAEWCRRDPKHAAAVARVEQTLAILQEMPAVRGPLEARIERVVNNGNSVTPYRGTGHFRRRLWAAGIAAALAIGAASWWVGHSSTATPQIYATASNGPQCVSLSDGSVIDLNSNSRIEVQLLEKERLITLKRGEAHFQVAHNAIRPFIVTANGVSVRAVGTAFDVRLAENKVDVLVSEGKVQVARQESVAFFSKKQIPVIPLLVAGEKTEVSSNRESPAQIEHVAPAEVRTLLSWQNRLTSFVDVPLREIVARINRAGSLQLVIGDPQLGDRRVGGVIDLNQVNAFVRLLEQDGDVVAERDSTGKIVLRRVQ